jgi:hypothetical protein
MQDCMYEKSYKKSILKKHLIYIKSRNHRWIISSSLKTKHV